MALQNKKPIIMVCGLLGTGKTAVSKFLLNSLKDYVRFNTDEVRRILGCKEFDRKDTPRVNEYMYSRARRLISEGRGVVFDSTYKLTEARQRVYDLAKECGVDMVVIQTVCSHETAIKRISNRPSKDGLHKPTNKIEDYEQYVKLWQDIFHELEDPSNSHVSYLKLNTENYKIEEVLIRSNIQNFANRIKNILSEFQGARKWLSK